MILFNKNNLIIELNFKLLLIDPNTRTIQKTLKIDINYYCGRDFELIPLNNSSFLAFTHDTIFQFEIKDSIIFFIGKSEFTASMIAKYPNN